VAELAARREALLVRSGVLRERLVECGQQLDESLTRVERGVGMLRSMASKPLLLAAGAGLLFAARRGGILKWVSRGLLVTSIARRVSGLFGRRREPDNWYAALRGD
jgi:hypothetical protein